MGYHDAMPLSRVQHDRKDIRNSIMVHQKDMGLVKWGKRTGSRQAAMRCQDEKKSVVVSKDYVAEKLGCNLAGLKIKSVEPGGAGWRGGLDGFVGRRITHVNGKPVGCADDVRAIASQEDEVKLQFRGVFEGKGRRSVSVPAGRSTDRHISHTRFARGHPIKNAESGIEHCMTVCGSGPPSPCLSPQRRHLNPPGTPRIRPYGTDEVFRELKEGGRENVPAVGAAPDMRPTVKRRFASVDAPSAKSPLRYKFPTNMSAAQMETYGLRPGGGALTGEERARSVRRGSSAGTRYGKAMRERPQDNIVSSTLCPTSESRWPGRSSSCPPEQRHLSTPASPGGKRRIDGKKGTTLTFLHHSAHPQTSQAWTPSWNSDRFTSPAASPGRARATNHPANKYNSTFLSEPRSFDTVRFRNPRRSAASVSRGQVDIGQRHQAPSIVPAGGKKTNHFGCKLPEAVDKYKGPTRRHPMPCPVSSDVMCTRTLPRNACRGEDVNNFDRRGKQQYAKQHTDPCSPRPIDPRPSPRAQSVEPHYPAPRQVSQRRAHTPGPAPPPFGTDYVSRWG